jgi:hypothetical protein
MVAVGAKGFVIVTAYPRNDDDFGEVKSMSPAKRPDVPEAFYHFAQ